MDKVTVIVEANAPTQKELCLIRRENRWARVREKRNTYRYAGQKILATTIIATNIAIEPLRQLTDHLVAWDYRLYEA